MWQLVINGPGYFETRYELAEGVAQVGRADENEIVLSGDLVSRQHGRLRAEQGGLSWEDLGSRNGSRINGQQVTGTTLLKPGDTVTVGENSLRVEQPGRAETAATDLVDTGGGGAVRRFGRGADLGEAVVAARDVDSSSTPQTLDDLAPVGAGPAAPPNLAAGTGAGPVAPQSLALLFGVAEQLATAPSLNVFLEETCDLLMKRVGASTGVVLLKHRTGVLVPAAVRHFGNLEKGEVPVSDAVIEAALSQERAIAVADVRDDARFAERDRVVTSGVDSVLCVPIGPMPFVGVLYLNRAAASTEPLDGLLDTCVAIAALVQAGVQRFRSAPEVEDTRLRRTLERFHGPEQLEARLTELVAAGGAALLEEKHGTVLVVELVGLSTLAHTVPAPKLSELLNRFSRTATQLVFSFGGTLIRCTGDAVVASFCGATPRGDAAVRAVRAASALKADWVVSQVHAPAEERLGLRAGLHTAKVLTGLVGANGRLDQAALGEAPAIAALLCSAADRDQILLSGKTLAVIGARFDVAPLGERSLPGTRLRTAVFEVLDEESDSGTLPGVR